MNYERGAKPNAGGPFLAAAWRHKIFHIFLFLQSDMVFEIASPFLCIFNAISGEKRGLISVHFLTC